MPVTTATPPRIGGVHQVLTLRARSEGGRVALLVDGRHPFTLEEWERRSNGAARALRAAGCRRGDRVGLLFGDADWVDYAVAYLGVLKAGAAAVHAAAALPAEEVARRFAQCGVACVVHAARLAPPPGPRALSADALAGEAAHPPRVRVGPADLADVVYTAGTTTGVPKPVAVPHRDHLHGFDPERHRAYEGARFLAPFPAGTASGQNILLFAITGGATVVLLSRADPSRVCERVESLRIDNLMVTPGMAVDMVNSPRARRRDLSSVTSLAMGASAMPAALLRRVAALFPRASLVQFYLSLESVPSMTATPFDAARPGAVGRPAGGAEVAIRDAAGAPLPPGEVGEIWMRTPGRIRAYHGAHPENARTFVDGWVRMGDLGFVDADGCLHFFDRAADAVCCGGRRVSTLRVEDALYHHPAVREACAVGIPHPQLGQVVGAALVLEPGTDPAEVAALAASRLQAHEAPARVVTAASLPRGLIGKVLKREVRTWFDPVHGERARRAHRRRRYW